MARRSRCPGLESASAARVSTSGHHEGIQPVVVLGRGGAGKSTLARQFGDVANLPVAELDTLS
jgi:ABC-type phosphate/phosphonate transport system ATPase subunit